MDEPAETYRVCNGSLVFRPFTASSIEEACEYVRQHQNPDWAAPRWLQVLRNGTFVWVR
jgi:hypothetical protein